MRRDAREVVFKLIFEYTFKNQINLEHLEEFFENKDYTLDENDKKYIRQVYSGTIENFDDLTAQIEEKASKFTTTRIYRTDLAVLYLALYELNFMKDIPQTVSVNEALDIAKKFGTEKSGSFVNGVLAKFMGEK